MKIRDFILSGDHAKFQIRCKNEAHAVCRNDALRLYGHLSLKSWTLISDSTIVIRSDDAWTHKSPYIDSVNLLRPRCKYIISMFDKTVFMTGSEIKKTFSQEELETLILSGCIRDPKVTFDFIKLYS